MCAEYGLLGSLNAMRDVVCIVVFAIVVSLRFCVLAACAIGR